MRLLKVVNESILDYEEWCKICDDFHNPLVACKDMTPKQAKFYLDTAMKKFEKEMYFIELEKFRRIFE